VGFLTAIYKTDSVLLALGATVMVFGSLTAYAKYTKSDFTGMGPYLMAALMSLMGFGFVLSLFSMFASVPPVMQTLYALGGTLIFSMYIVYDTQQILGGRSIELGVDEYVFAALNLYLDIINLFITLLQLMLGWVKGRIESVQRSRQPVLMSDVIVPDISSVCLVHQSFRLVFKEFIQRQQHSAIQICMSIVTQPLCVPDAKCATECCTASQLFKLTASHTRTGARAASEENDRSREVIPAASMRRQICAGSEDEPGSPETQGRNGLKGSITIDQLQDTGGGRRPNASRRRSVGALQVVGPPPGTFAMPEAKLEPSRRFSTLPSVKEGVSLAQRRETSAKRGSTLGLIQTNFGNRRRSSLVSGGSDAP
ncbi:unnamed protein product, partial [Polarella glacialis]